MPMRSHAILDDAGRVIGMACYREQRASCQTKHCAGAAVVLCDYPVKRRGKASTCNRHVCRGCAVNVGPELDYCPPHARLYAADAPRRADEAKLAEILAGFTPCETNGAAAESAVLPSEHPVPERPAAAPADEVEP